MSIFIFLKYLPASYRRYLPTSAAFSFQMLLFYFGIICKKKAHVLRFKSEDWKSSFTNEAYLALTFSVMLKIRVKGVTSVSICQNICKYDIYVGQLENNKESIVVLLKQLYLQKLVEYQVLSFQLTMTCVLPWIPSLIQTEVLSIESFRECIVNLIDKLFKNYRLTQSFFEYVIRDV